MNFFLSIVALTSPFCILFAQGCFETGIAYPGNDLGGKRNANSPEACQQLCQETDECVGFTFRASKNKCWLKKTESEGQNSNGAISGPRDCVKCDDQEVNCPHGMICDYRSYVENSSRYHHCRNDPCLTKPCYNGATCIVNEDIEAECPCPYGYEGDQCEEATICDPPCSNTGLCYRNNNDQAICYCYSGYSGEQCDKGCARPPPNADESLTCGDGTKCNPKIGGWSCCVAHGGRTNCPKSEPVMCSTPDKCGGGQDYCCAENADHCIAQEAGPPMCISDE